MNHRVGVATTCLHLSAALYVLIGICLFWLLSSQQESHEFPLGAVVLMLCLVLAAGIEYVAYGLNQRKFWAWVAGLIIFGLYVPSAFLPLGGFGLWGLLDKGTRAEFSIGDRNENE